jgi:2-polyprenyl-3-methyl-5-hydroxy-6-metoxy-1,4-benzoquinol methylase
MSLAADLGGTTLARGSLDPLPMTALDRLIRQWRESKVQPYLRAGMRVLDIGCGDGTLFQRSRGKLVSGIGIDPTLERDVDRSRYQLLAGWFPDRLPSEASFDVITLLAVLEHIPEPQQPVFAANIAERLTPGGHLVITVPSPRVDAILDGLRALRLIDGMSLEQHYGFSADRTPQVFGGAGLNLVEWRRFQLGLNNLFVFRKP